MFRDSIVEPTHLIFWIDETAERFELLRKFLDFLARFQSVENGQLGPLEMQAPKKRVVLVTRGLIGLADENRAKFDVGV